MSGVGASSLVQVERRDDGTLVLRSPRALQAYPRHLGHHLRRWAGECPDRIFLAERDPARSLKKYSKTVA